MINLYDFVYFKGRTEINQLFREILGNILDNWSKFVFASDVYWRSFLMSEVVFLKTSSVYAPAFLTFNSRNNYLFSAGVSQTGSVALGFGLESIHPLVLRGRRRTLSSLLNCLKPKGKWRRCGSGKMGKRFEMELLLHSSVSWCFDISVWRLQGFSPETTAAHFGQKLKLFQLSMFYHAKTAHFCLFHWVFSFIH